MSTGTVSGADEINTLASSVRFGNKLRCYSILLIAIGFVKCERCIGGILVCSYALHRAFRIRVKVFSGYAYGASSVQGHEYATLVVNLLRSSFGFHGNDG